MKKRLTITASLLVALLIFLVSFVSKPEPNRAAAIGTAVTRSLTLLQLSSYKFTNNSPAKCAACHHNTLTSMVAALGREKGLPVVDSFTTGRIIAMEANIIYVCNAAHVNSLVPANFLAPYVLLGLDAEKYAPNLYTDIAVDYIMSQAKDDGSYLTEAGRVPLECGRIHLTAMATRAIDLYASPVKRKEVDALIAGSRRWMENQHPTEQQELAFQLLGLHWCGGAMAVQTSVARALEAIQQPDGGWGQLPNMQTDAYATGQSLYALFESGLLKPDEPVARHAIDYLLKTQTKEGAWVVKTRSYPIQKFVDSDFPPYDDNQFISAAASNWSTLALLDAMPSKTK